MTLWNTRKVVMCLAVVMLGLAAWSTGPPQANAARCMEHNKLVEFLDKQFGEKPRAIGLISPKAMMEVFVSKRGTWTISITSTERMSCVVSSGDTWAEISAPPGPGA